MKMFLQKTFKIGLNVYHFLAFLSVIIICTAIISAFISYITDITKNVEESTYNTAFIKLYGEITQEEADKVLSKLKQAENNNDISYVILEINSTGGSYVFSEEIADYIKNMKTHVVCYIRAFGASGAYLVATSTERIFASVGSNLLSIGVQDAYLETVERNKKEGFKYVELYSGKYKLMGDPNRALTDEEKQMIQNRLNKIHEIFINKVSENRKLDVNTVRQYSDGAIMLGMDAINKGFIDEIGGYNEVIKYLSEKYKIEVQVEEL